MPISHDMPIANEQRLLPPQLEPFRMMEEPGKIAITCPRNSELDCRLWTVYREERAYPYKGATYWIRKAAHEGAEAHYELVELAPPKRATIPPHITPHIPPHFVDVLDPVWSVAPALPDPLVSTQAPPPPPTHSDVVFSKGMTRPKLVPPVDMGALIWERAYEALREAAKTNHVVVTREQFQALTQVVTNAPPLDLRPGGPPTLPPPPAPPVFAMVETRAQQAVQRALQQPQHQRAGLLGLSNHYDW